MEVCIQNGVDGIHLLHKIIKLISETQLTSCKVFVIIYFIYLLQYENIIIIVSQKKRARENDKKSEFFLILFPTMMYCITLYTFKYKYIYSLNY